jgi:RHS repeat-associated protein
MVTPAGTLGLLWDRAGDLPEIIADGTAGFVHAPLQTISTTSGVGLEDGLGSIRLVADPTGTTTTTVAYEPFGEPTSAGGVFRFGYTGEWTDPPGLIYLRARVYDPQTGRFLTPDPIQPNHPSTQGWNHYTYAANNPTTLTDPTGFAPLFEYAAVGAGFGTITGLGIGLRVCLTPGQRDPGACVLTATIIGLTTGGLFGIPGGILSAAAVEVGLTAASLGYWALAAFSVAAACIGGGELGRLEDQVLSDVLGKEPNPDQARLFGCVAGSAGFFGGGGLTPGLVLVFGS